MQVRSTNQITAADGIKCVIYGRSGTGKTYSLASAPAPFILSAEKGLLSLRKLSVAYTEINTYKELTDAYMWVMQSSEAKKFQTYALDSMSEIAEVVLAEELRKTKDPRKAYGEMQQQMYNLIRNFRDLKGKNVVFIAKQMLIEEGQLPVIQRASPLMPSKALQNATPYFFDLILHMDILKHDGVNYRVLHTCSSLEWDAKDRSGNLNPIEQPDFSAIFKKCTT
jgi:hypothetical protein